VNNDSVDAGNRFLALINLLVGEVPPGSQAVALEGPGLHAALQGLDRELPPFLRTLLVADGTVTMAIEAYYGESIEVRTINQLAMSLPEAMPMLGVEAATDILYREVILQGSDSGRVYACAYSMIRRSVIADSLYRELVAERVGIGTLLRNTAKGSYREILSIRQGGIADVGDQLITDVSHSDEDLDNSIEKGLVSRTYCVYLDSKPGILITEVFPVSPYLSRDNNEQAK